MKKQYRPCDGCRYELNATNGFPCYSCGGYKVIEKTPITISQLSDLIAYEVYNLVTYIRVYEVDKCYTTCVIIHNETEVCIFTDIFGDAKIDAVEGDINCVIGNIHFNDLNTVELLKKVDEYNHKVYL